MATLKELKVRRKSVVSTKKVTSAMKMIAAGKLKRSLDNMQKAIPFARSIKDVVKMLIFIERKLYEQYFQVQGTRTIFVLVTADRGMCGGFNNNVLKKFKLIYNPENGDRVIGIGNKAADYLKRNHVEGVVATFPDFYINMDFSKIEEVSQQVFEQVRSDQIDRVVYVYNRFVSALSQEVITETVLPVDMDMAETRRKNLEMKAEAIYEPSSLAVFDDIFPQYLKGVLWKDVQESVAAENAARMATMESATDNASQMIEQLTLEINKARQAGITQEISEIVAGSESTN